MELHSPKLRRRKKLTVSFRMFSLKVKTNKPLFWIDLPHSCMILWSQEKDLRGLIPSKALGPEEFHHRVQKELAMELGPVFVHLFQQSIDTGENPKERSIANIYPVFKKDDRSLARNFHPVSLTCIPCKLLEHIVVQIL